MRKRLGIALVVAAVAIGVLIVATARRETSAEDHLRAYYAAQRNSHLVSGGIGVPRVRDRLARHWYKWRGKGSVEFLNEMAKHHKALEDLGFLETRFFVVSNRPAVSVSMDVWAQARAAGPITVVNGLANVWISPTNRVYVMAPKTEMPKWERWIREADVPK